MSDTTVEKARKFAKDFELELPKESSHKIMMAGIGLETVPIAENIEGYYHALYLRDRLSEEVGHAGVSFHVEKG